MDSSWNHRKEDVLQMVASHMDKLYSAWEVMGLPKEQQGKRCETASLHLQNLLNDMVKEENKLIGKLQETCTRHEKQITDMCAELGLEFTKPSSQLSLLKREKDLRRKLDEVQGKRNERLSDYAKLREEEQQLCDELYITPVYIPSGHLPSLNEMQLIRDHVAELKQRKLDNMHKLISAARHELVEWWNKACVSESRRRCFVPFTTEKMSEDILDQLRDETNRIKTYYQENADMLAKVERWQKLWVEFQEVERKAADPNRLFNRGCNLLKEEKARKKIQKELPKVEREVASQIEEWEKTNDREFMVGGLRFIDYIKEQWKDYQENKESAKESRMKSKAQELEEEMMYGSRPVTPGKRRMAGATIIKTPTKYQRVDDTHYHTPRSMSRMASSSRLGSAARLHSASRLQSVNRLTPAHRYKATHTSSPVLYTPKLTKQPKSGPLPKSSRAALSERNAPSSTASNDTIFSQTAVSGSLETPTSASVAPIGQYTDFAKGLNVTQKLNHRSTVLL